MPLVRSALIATAACLIGAAAYAQPTTADQTPPPAGDQSMPQAPPENSAPTPPPTDQSAPPAPSSDMSAPPAQTGAAANTSATVNASGTEVIASQPVPDTPANRAAYGAPLSHAGKHTAPKGN
jgi:hypothetical protein